jgi:hypothetical protein
MMSEMKQLRAVAFGSLVTLGALVVLLFVTSLVVGRMSSASDDLDSTVDVATTLLYASTLLAGAAGGVMTARMLEGAWGFGRSLLLSAAGPLAMGLVLLVLGGSEDLRAAESLSALLLLASGAVAGSWFVAKITTEDFQS